MLDPRRRGALLEALRPPAGYVVDCAVATTYSLDLIALLTAPLAFSLYDRLASQKGDASPERIDSFALLHAVRQHAERLVVFCQAGCIAKPTGYRQLLAYLEQTLVQVTAPNGAGVFHPKLWIQRFTPAHEGDPIRYRVLCNTRNLTFDRSWDTMLSLDGELVERTLAIGESKPLAEFVRTLPSLAIDGPKALMPARRQLVERIADELRTVRFEVPDGFESFRFWPLGHDGKKRDPFGDTRIERLLVVSPFVSAERLDLLAAHGKNNILVSTVEQLEVIPPKVLAQYAEVNVLHDAAEDLDTETDGETEEREETNAPVPPARGLHAKLYVADDGRNAHVWTGSANASSGGFIMNVEFLVQLTGKKKHAGVDRFLGDEDGKGGLRMLTKPFVAGPEAVVRPAAEVALERAARQVVDALSRSRWQGSVFAEGRGGAESEMYRLELRLVTEPTLILPADSAVKMWPISLSEARAMPFDPKERRVVFDRCSLQALTAFIAVAVTVRVEDLEKAIVFVMRVPLEGLPADRDARILHALLDDPAKVMRFLRLLLAADGADALEALDVLLDGADEAGARDGTGAREADVPLFEALVRTLDREPHRLREVERLVRELGSMPAGREKLPPEFDAVWGSIWQAYESLERETPKRGGAL